MVNNQLTQTSVLATPESLISEKKIFAIKDQSINQIFAFMSYLQIKRINIIREEGSKYQPIFCFHVLS